MGTYENKFRINTIQTFFIIFFIYIIEIWSDQTIQILIEIAAILTVFYRSNLFLIRYFVGSKHKNKLREMSTVPIKNIYNWIKYLENSQKSSKRI